MNNKFFKVDENMIMWAFRYALGRKTGAVDSVLRHLKIHWPMLEKSTQIQIRSEIKHAIQVGCAGHDCDIKQWRELL